MQLRKSILITFLSSNSSTLVFFGVTVVLARLLTPADIGVFSIAVVFINLVAVFRDFGVASYLVREPDLKAQQVRSALGLVLTTSWILAGGLYLGAAPIARFYGQPGIADVMQVLTLSFLLVPYASVLSALLMREMAAGKNAFVSAVSTAVYAATCITLATLGFGYMAMAWANVANLLTNIAAFIYVRPKGMVLLPSFRGWRGPVRFGGGAILGNLVTIGNNSVPDLVLGKLNGPHEVGLYSRASGFVGIFQQVAGPAINYNALPFIAQRHHAQEALGPLLARSTSYLTGLAWPAYAVAAVFAAEFIEVLYGAAWLEAAPLVALLCLGSAARAGYQVSHAALLAIGKPYIAAASAGAGLAARLILLLSLSWLGYGVDDLWFFVAVICVADIVTVPVPAWLMARHLGYPLAMSLGAQLASLKVATACLAGALVLQAVLPSEWPAIAVALMAAVFLAGIWAAAIVGFKHPLVAEGRRILAARQNP